LVFEVSQVSLEDVGDTRGALCLSLTRKHPSAEHFNHGEGMGGGVVVIVGVGGGRREQTTFAQHTATAAASTATISGSSST
jgi:hypothetical protein